MFGQGTFNIIDGLLADLQARVGIFVQAKSKLITIVSSPVLTISDKAKNLYQTQLALESQLADTLTLVNRVTTDVYTASDIVAISGFYIQMEKQISDVDSLYNQYTGTPGAQASTIFGIDTKTAMIIGGIGVGLFLITR